MALPIPGVGSLTSGDLNPLTSQFGHLSLQDKAFLDAFNRQEQQELHGVPRPGPVDPTTLLGQLEQVTQISRIQRQGSIQSTGSGGTTAEHQTAPGSSPGSTSQQRHHEVVSELAAEEVRWFFKREVDKDWSAFNGYDSLRIELRYRHIWQTKWSDVDRRTNTLDLRGRGAATNMMGMPPSSRGGRRARSLNRVHYDRAASVGMGNGYEDEEYLDDPLGERGGVSFREDYPDTPPSGGSPGGYGRESRGGYASRGRYRSHKQYRSADNFMEDDRDMHIVVRGGVYEVDLAEWKCHSLYWPGEAFDIMRGTWFYETTWQPVQCEYADRIEQEHLQRFLGHKMADYIWDSNTSQRLDKQRRRSFSISDRQVHHTTSFPEFHVDWMSPEEVYLHRENTSSQIYRGISASLGFKKPTGYRLFRGYKELCQHTDRLPDITHIVFVVHGVGQVVDDTTIIRNTNIMRDNVNQILNKHFPQFPKESGQRVEFFPVEWRSSLRLDEGMVKHITPQRIMGLRNMLNSGAMDIMYYTSPLYRMEIWQTLQEELNRLYEMFVQRNPYFEANGGKVSIVAHSLGCVVTYDILTGWTMDVEHSWYNLQTRGGGVPDLKRSRRFRGPGSTGGPGGPGGGGMVSAQTGLLFRIENFFCLGSPLAVFLVLRWRDPTNQEYHDHILPRSLCKYLYNVYHPCDPVAYRVEPIFMKFYSQVEPVHVFSTLDSHKMPYSELPLQPLQNARKEDEAANEHGVAGLNPAHILPVNIANGSIQLSVGKMLPTQAPAVNLPKMPSMSPSISLPKMPNVPGVPGLSGGSGASTSSAAASFQHQLNGAGGAVGAAAGGMLGGLMGMVKDAAAAVTPASSGDTATTTQSTTASTRPGMPAVLPSASASATTRSGTSSTAASVLNSMSSIPGMSSLSRGAGIAGAPGTGPSSGSAVPAAGGAASQHLGPGPQIPGGGGGSSSPLPSHIQEVKLPDGQRLAYRMDYILRETGNTYIAAVTSHTAYWGNPDVAYFMLCKLHPELEYYAQNHQTTSQQPHHQQPSQQQQQQQQQQSQQPGTGSSSAAQQQQQQPLHSHGHSLHQQQQQQQAVYHGQSQSQAPSFHHHSPQLHHGQGGQQTVQQQQQQAQQQAQQQQQSGHAPHHHQYSQQLHHHSQQQYHQR